MFTWLTSFRKKPSAQITSVTVHAISEVNKSNSITSAEDLPIISSCALNEHGQKVESTDEWEEVYFDFFEKNIGKATYVLSAVDRITGRFQIGTTVWQVNKNGAGLFVVHGQMSDEFKITPMNLEILDKQEFDYGSRLGAGITFNGICFSAKVKIPELNVTRVMPVLIFGQTIALYTQKANRIFHYNPNVEEDVKKFVDAEIAKQKYNQKMTKLAQGACAK